MCLRIMRSLLIITIVYLFLFESCVSSKLKDLLEDLIPVALNQFEETCSRTCKEVDCDKVTIRYGKFCGIHYGGCKGEQPCDGVDACCQAHDQCVDSSGYTNTACHSELITCLQSHRGSTGFSKKCPYSVVIPNIERNMLAAVTATHLWKEL